MQYWSRRFALTILILFAALSDLPIEGQEISYRRITMKNKLKKFYQDGGRKYYGKLVHIYIPAGVFKKEPKIMKGKRGNLLLCFKNKSVPIIVSPKNLYYKRLMRKLGRKNNRIETISVYGKIIRPSWDVKGRCHLKVFKLKTFGGTLKKNAG